MDKEIAIERRDFLKSTAALSALAILSDQTTPVARADEIAVPVASPSGGVRMSDIPISPNAKISVERRVPLS
jgi:hypothetical protein